jgi:hypothetical protein
VLQRFRFPNPVIMAPHSVLDQFVDSSDHFFIRLQPVLVIFPSLGRKLLFEQVAVGATSFKKE